MAIVNRRFPMRHVRANGRVYLVDPDLIPALRHIPRELITPVLEALERDLRSRLRQRLRAADRASNWRAKWVDQSTHMVLAGKSYAAIGRHIAARNKELAGSADRIARTLAKLHGPRKK